MTPPHLATTLGVPLQLQPTPAVLIRPARKEDRAAIYRMRHDVYADELGQHAARPEAALSDWVDDVNVYFVAEADEKIVGFVSVTPPNPRGFSIDRYLKRTELPIPVDAGLHEVRLLTVLASHRRSGLAFHLMLAALRAVAARGGTSIMAIGRVEILAMYEAAGLRRLGVRVTSGAVTFELLHASVEELQRRAAQYVQANPDFLGQVSTVEATAAPHGGRAFEEGGPSFCPPDAIAADVLDAWFDPAPAVVEAVRSHLPWLLRTSPPVGPGHLARSIAEARGVPESTILPGAGSSDLIHRALRQQLSPVSRVLVLDPTYSEYPHLVDLIGCRVDRLRLAAADGYRVPPQELESRLALGYDWVLLVNPNNPTGQTLDRATLEAIIRRAPERTRFWVDETYADFAGPDVTLEALAATDRRVVVCKSMSKAYALSGVRVAYLCAHPETLQALRISMPPWSVGLVAQAAACAALGQTEYYAHQWTMTRELAADLRQGLAGLGWSVTEGVGNFVLCRVADSHPPASQIIEAAAGHGLYLRGTQGMGEALDDRMLRVAVRDGPTNRAMLDVLGRVLAIPA